MIKGKYGPKIAGVIFNLISYEDVLRIIHIWKKTKARRFITITNPYSVMLCKSDIKMKVATNKASLTLPDGIGIILAACILGFRHKGRVAGPDLMHYICDKGRRYGFKHYFYGGAPGIAKSLINRMKKTYPGCNIVGYLSPPFCTNIVEAKKNDLMNINQLKPDILWVGLGAPKQEIWMEKYVGKINSSAMIGVGAAFDFNSGNIKRAPRIFRKIGFEWLWRTLIEPRRMAVRRINDVLFMLIVIYQKILRSLSAF
jgi:N-acetylglucosaminyldiphosphoundecaprenol N-acetyl-beta-D-mannosaminyltransferase